MTIHEQATEKELGFTFGKGPYDATGGCGGDCRVSLTCPFPLCLDDYPGGARAWTIDERNIGIVKDRDDGLSVYLLMERYELSERQIQRVLATAKEAS